MKNTVEKKVRLPMRKNGILKLKKGSHNSQAQHYCRTNIKSFLHTLS